MLFQLHYVLAIVCILSRDRHIHVLLYGPQLAVEAVSNFLQCLLDLVDSDLVLHLLIGPLFELASARVERVLYLADHIALDRLLSLVQAPQDFLVGSFYHLAEHFNVLLPILHHFFHVHFDLALNDIGPLHCLGLMHLKFAFDPTQSQVLLLHLCANFLLMALQLLGEGQDPRD